MWYSVCRTVYERVLDVRRALYVRILSVRCTVYVRVLSVRRTVYVCCTVYVVQCMCVYWM